jgi:hypothetical protein
MKNIITFITILILTNSVFGQVTNNYNGLSDLNNKDYFLNSNYEKFISYLETKDTINIKKLLSNWENEKRIDAEFYVCSSKYYFDLSHIDIDSTDSQPKIDKKEALKITTEDGREYFINSNSVFDEKLLSKALSYATAGIIKSPRRLDLRFRKFYILKAMQDYENLTKELIETVELSKKIYRWSGLNNEDEINDKVMILNYIHDIQFLLLGTDDYNLLKNVIEIGIKAIEHYPNQVEIISLTAYAYTLHKNFDKAIEYLKIAEKLNEKDYYVLGEIAENYKRKGDKENAIKYFELCKQYGDNQAKVIANKKLEELKK